MKPSEIHVKVKIQPGPASPAMKTAFHKFFARLIAEAQRELKAESEVKK